VYDCANFIDGDLVEQYLGLGVEDQEFVVRDLELEANGMKMTCSRRHLAEIIEGLTRIH